MALKILCRLGSPN